MPKENGTTAEHIGKLRVLSRNLAEEVERTLPAILESLQSAKFKHSARALVNFIPRSGYLCNAILTSCLTSDGYSPKVLMRSLIEHVFIHLYIYVRTLKEQNDGVGKQYYGSLKRKEELEALEKISNFHNAVSPEKTKWSTAGKENNAIREDAKQFRIERIFYYLIGNVGTESDIFQRYENDYLLHRIEQYTKCSSAVHGGPYAEAEHTAEYSRKNEVIAAFADDAWLLHRSLVETTYLFASLLDESVSKSYDAIKAVSAKA